MKRTGFAISVAAVTLAALASTVWGQRGVGKSTGIARLAERPKVIELTGTLEAIQVGPCEHTTGRSPVGVHIVLVQDKDKKLNVHLGPAGAVQSLISHLKTGDKLTVAAFRTDALPADQYIAKSLSVDGKVVTLRDASLRPFWAGGRSGNAGHGPRGRGGPSNVDFKGVGFRGPRGWSAATNARDAASTPAEVSTTKSESTAQGETNESPQVAEEQWGGCRQGRGYGWGHGFGSGPGPGPGRGPRW